MMRYKACPAFKAASSEDGMFEAIVSVFNNKDRMNEVVKPGAFADTLAEWKASGDPIPVLWSHNMSDPRYTIGAVLEAAELGPDDSKIPDWVDPFVKANGGLWVRGQIHTGADASEIATAGRKLLQKRLVKQFSYAYDIMDGRFGTMDGEDVYELHTVKLFEVSPTPLGANDLTMLLGAKAAALVSSMSGNDPTTALRLVAGMDETEIREALAVLAKSLVDRRASKNDGEPLTPENRTAKDEDRDGGKSEEPHGLDDESVRLMQDLAAFELEVSIS